MLTRLVRSLTRPDFRADPWRALSRRLAWKLRWLRTREPWRLTLPNGSPILVPAGGAGALIYYQGFSETDTADFVLRFLAPGMTFLDIGAHFGEYTVLAASRVGEGGRVHAFEPNPEIFDLLSENVRINALENVRLHPTAVSDREGQQEFRVFREPSLSSLMPPSAGGRAVGRGERSFPVRTVCLDGLIDDIGGRIDLVKVDVEGAEMLVFRGAGALLRLPADQAPVWIFEHAAENYAAFGFRTSEVLSLLDAHGYEIHTYSALQGLGPVSSRALPSDVINLVAVKKGRARPFRWTHEQNS